MSETTTDRIVMEVARYRPGTDTKPVLQSYEVPVTREWAVLDGLNYIKDRLDGTLSFRWSCRMGICGSCGMTINGDPKLACATFLVDYLPGPVRVEPMRNFPVIRDLVVDISDFMTKLPKVKPWIIRDDEQPPDREYLQTPVEMAEYKQFSMCINCMLCYAACPVYALDPVFLGPAAIALGQRYNLDSRDDGAADRADVLAAADGAWACTYVGECSAACPKGVDPAGAIQRYKLMAATHSVRDLVMPRGAR
ncbi:MULTISPECIES: succinate dehydrogenase/fumarate reductase iron-sulfur subunit [unclassified Mycolicibacterium]|uniref:succinate dehydrogenase/fumarate reductase iron-sulfur subunit n=1 Tax=unclassified Mycolicibacterium TaxID=2636767 RepID=UPI002ED8499C